MTSEYMDKFIDIFTENIVAIMEVNILLILALVAALLFITIRSKDKTESSGDGVSPGQVSQLEETLKKVLEQTQGVAPAVTAGALAGVRHLKISNEKRHRSEEHTSELQSLVVI